MNPLLQRYLPPLLVFGAALFFGWPPSAPLDLGDDVVRATSVRWRPDDLVDPPVIEPASNPFQAVLVADEASIVEPELAQPTRPAGPTAEVLTSGLRLDGIASMGGRRWAVLNSRPRLVGDLVRTSDTERHQCEIVSIETDHVVVRCQETVAKLQPRPAGSQRPAAASQVPAAAPDRDNQPSADEVPPPPQG